MAGVVLDARAEADLAHHLDVVGRAHPQPLRLEQLALPLHLGEPVRELELDAGDRLLHALGPGDVVGGGEDVEMLVLGDDLAGERVQRHQPLDLVAEHLHPDRVLLVDREDLQGVAADPERAVSTLADQVGACTTALQPLHALIERHVLAAERLHGDDTTVPILAKGKTVTGRIWTYVRDDRPFGGHAPPAALYYASRDRKHEHPVQHLQAFTGILQADAYSGYNELYDPSRSQGAITAALCWAHARRQFFELADIAANARRGKNAAAISPVALAAVKRIDALFDIERDINGLSAEERLRVRQEQSAPLLAALEAWLREEHSRLSRSASVAQPIDYMLKRWDRFARFIEDGRVCLTNNAAERALRGFAMRESLCIPSSSVCKHWNRVCRQRRDTGDPFGPSRL